MPQADDDATYRRCRLLTTARAGTLRRTAARRGDVTTGRLVSRMPYAPVVSVRPTVDGRGEAVVPVWAVEWLEEA